VNIEDESPPGEEEPLVAEPLHDEERLLVIFAYMGPLAIVSLAAARSDFVRWHARQGLLLGVVTLVTFVVLRPLHSLMYIIWPFLGEIFLTMEILIGFGFFLVAVLCLVRGIERTRFRIPFLADLADRF
jgi:uncharacterized membrane protein